MDMPTTAVRPTGAGTRRAGTPAWSPAGVFADLLPPTCVVSEIHGDVADVALFPEEAAAIARALPSRRAEFATTRLCARLALADLGQSFGALLPGRCGEPSWPAGVVGSLTHCAGFRAAALARADDVLAVGIDAEPDLPLPDGVIDQIAPTASERVHLAGLAAEDPSTPWDRILFCAKEAVYKVWSPLTGAWLGFEDADVRMDVGIRTGKADRTGAFAVRLLVDGPPVRGEPPIRMSGRWSRRDGRLHAAICLPALA